jgi:uncharacterized phiE125 gp8 family phage protein
MTYKSLYPTTQQSEQPAEELQIDIISAPAINPVTLPETKSYLRVDVDDDDGLITALIVAATNKAEEHLNRALISQTLMAQWYRFFSVAKLPRPPHQIINKVEVREHEAGAVWEEIAAADYDQSGLECFTIRTSVSFTASGYSEQELRVTYLAGYGIYVAQVPQPICTAIMDMVAFAYEHRGEGATAALLTPLAKSLLNPYRVF